MRRASQNAMKPRIQRDLTPWKPGEDVIIAGSVSNDQAKEIFGQWESPKPYIRIVPQPK